MKKCIILVIVAIICHTKASVFAQTGKPVTDTMNAYYSGLAKSQNQADKDLLEVKMYELLKSNKEEDWSTAQRFFKELKKTNVSDSLTSIMITKFPKGQAAGHAAFMKVLNIKGAAEKEAAFNTLVKNFPPIKIETTTTHDIASSFVAFSFAEEDNPKKALFYMNMIESKSRKCQSAHAVGTSFLKYGHYKEAKEVIKEAIENAYKYKTIWKDSAGAKGPTAIYPSLMGMYARVLYEEKNYQGALVYQQKAYDETDTSRRIGMNELFANIYIALGKDKEAFEKLDESVRQGLATPEMKENLKLLYKKVIGDAGFDEYMANVQRVIGEKIRKDLGKQIINEPAPAFTLTDYSGKQVSLESLKGKIVIVDFWATWCAPCKASFPAMQTAVTKYKDDPKVEFLFIHTWEKEEQKLASENAAKFIADKKYSFKVLMDLKDKVTGTNKVVSSFNVKGIPTKFVIDKNGNIRFKFVGFSGGDDIAVEEIDAMIELTQKNTVL